MMRALKVIALRSLIVLLNLALIALMPRIIGVGEAGVVLHAINIVFFFSQLGVAGIQPLFYRNFSHDGIYGGKLGLGILTNVLLVVPITILFVNIFFIGIWEYIIGSFLRFNPILLFVPIVSLSLLISYYLNSIGRQLISVIYDRFFINVVILLVLSLVPLLSNAKIASISQNSLLFLFATFTVHAVWVLYSVFKNPFSFNWPITVSSSTIPLGPLGYFYISAFTSILVVNIPSLIVGTYGSAESLFILNVGLRFVSIFILFNTLVVAAFAPYYEPVTRYSFGNVLSASYLVCILVGIAFSILVFFFLLIFDDTVASVFLVSIEFVHFLQKVAVFMGIFFLIGPVGVVFNNSRHYKLSPYLAMLSLSLAVYLLWYFGLMNDMTRTILVIPLYFVLLKIFQTIFVLFR